MLIVAESALKLLPLAHQACVLYSVFPCGDQEQKSKCVCSLQVIILLLFARAWSRVLDLLLPLGFLLLLLSILPHYFTFTNLARLLDGDAEVDLKV